LIRVVKLDCETQSFPGCVCALARNIYLKVQSTSGHKSFWIWAGNMQRAVVVVVNE
jgi:hypothetical protein